MPHAAARVGLARLVSGWQCDSGSQRVRTVVCASEVLVPLTWAQQFSMLTAARATPTATRRAQQQGPEEGIDHLFLLPERVLGMDSAQLRQDLAGLDFSCQLLQTAPQGNVWLCECLYLSRTICVLVFVFLYVIQINETPDVASLKKKKITY